MERDKLEYPNPINWSNLSTALNFYKTKFKYVEVPWLAPEEIMRITYDGPYRFKTEIGDPVASGEQSFLHLQLNQGLELGKYMTITPCFRDEPETEFNFKQFMKLELYVTDDTSLESLHSVMGMCRNFLNNLISIACRERIHCSTIDMDDGTFDLQCEDIELGSYGVREHESHKWIYATGIAEPRTSQVINIAKKRLDGILGLNRS